ncbi:MAG TPA: hypothetical protein P5307_15475, partial [Pirellulaceae bacterium]|nr:hypothetical protein [Pirellulaceae bacterium]
MQTKSLNDQNYYAWNAQPDFTAAVTYYCIANAIVFIIQCLVVGTVSGAHFFLLAGPVVMLFLGARRSTLSFVLTAMLVGT